MNVLFRCDGSVEIGMGHVVRCMALAEYLKDNHDLNIHFAMRQSELGISKVKESYPVLESNEAIFDYEDWLSDCIHQTNAEILIMDMRDGLTREKLKRVKKRTGIKVVTIDDLEDKRLQADFAFYPPIPQLENVHWKGFNGKLYVGWEYVILRKEFYQSYSEPNNPTPNILVSMGGADEKDMTKYVISALDLIETQFTATIILGPGYQFQNDLVCRLDKIGFPYKIYSAPNDIADVMSRSDLAVISYGQTAYELAALQIPAIYLCLSEDHFISSQLFQKTGIGFSLGEFEGINDKKIVGAIQAYLNEIKDTKKNKKQNIIPFLPGKTHQIAEIIAMIK